MTFGRNQLVHIALLLASSLGGCARLQHRLAATDPDRRQGRLFANQGVQAAETGRWAEAKNWLQQAVEATPDDAATQCQLADALWNNGDQSSAVKHIQLAHQLEPKDLRTTLRCGEMLLETGATLLALARAEEALALDHISPEAWALRGRAHRRLGDAVRAQADFERALVDQPNSAPLLQELALAYRDGGQPQRFLATVQRLVDQHPLGEQPAALLTLEGEAYLAAARPLEAVDSLRLAVAAPDAAPDTWCWLAAAESAAGRPDLALAAAQQAVALDPASARGQQLVAQLTQPDQLLR